MIVEDDIGISRYLQSTLASAGYDTVTVRDGRTALALIASHCPDCLLLDLGRRRDHPQRSQMEQRTHHCNLRQNDRR